MLGHCHLLVLLAGFGAGVSALRSFSIDHANNQFLKDGQPFRYISGSIHYFRTHPDQWQARLATVRAAGLNAIETYIPWNFHETYKNQYDFTGMRNFSRFFELAAQNELVVIVRPGPYICAEWENGGLPYWLLKYPNIKQRSSDADFLRESLAWWDVLLPMIRPYLWKNNGPVVMVQIENEYGSYGCDHVYLRALRDNAVKNLGNDTVLFTTDPPEEIECGAIDDVYATVDFGERGLLLADEYFKIQRDANKRKGGPSVNSEAYPGWYRTWGEGGILENPSASRVLELTETLYNANASFNFYMFHGGTNFGFWNGAEKPAGLITSYDYFAPMAENGDYNVKYTTIRDFISGIEGWPNPIKPLPQRPRTFSQSNITMSKIGNWFDYETKTINQSRCVQTVVPKTFEELDQAMGFVKYSIRLNIGGSVLEGTGVHDFGYVFVNKQFQGRLSPHYSPHEVNQLKLSLKKNDLLEIYVENQGRRTWETINDYKGMVDAVKLDGAQLTGWTSCAVDVDQLTSATDTNVPSSFNVGDVFRATFHATGTGDAFIDMSNWGKGVAWLNRFNLGRYWASAGPQKYLYIPAPLFTSGSGPNTLVFLELEKFSSDCKSSSCSVNLIDHPLHFK
ncbi:hypothetical protein Q1695_007233 [Nippostrongylus brasiliensis]|nr:hypothetical protein Q1695_007233 [Nippostrongylus brasiliensis]